MQAMQILYAAVTADKYELILAIADTAQELADLTGYSKNTIFSDISKKRNGSTRGMKFIRIKTEEDPPAPVCKQRGFRLEDYIISAPDWKACTKQGEENL